MPAVRLIHTDLRYTLFRQAKLNFDKAPKPANLHFLADQLSSAELQELIDGTLATL